MSTPSIQTLITQAQQVLNLKSSNEIRATLAAVLANANVGTPLNPNLTTQQLWDEFYEIVRQPSDDIMSIITDQMMRMVFSPPAPGGAGADKQVIFNDGGVLAGDPDLIFNKALNKLVANNIETAAGLLVGTSATITGAATVGTTLGVTSSLTVGTGANSAVQKAAILGGYTVFENSAGTGNPSITFNNDTDTGILNNGANVLQFNTAGVERARFNQTGAFVLYGGTAGANGIGIAFPTTQSDSSDANCLDDYEEGTWSPTPSGNVNLTSVVSVSARYTKVGRLVTLSGQVTATVTLPNIVTYFVLPSLPFANNGTTTGAVQENGNLTIGAIQVASSNLYGFFPAASAIVSGAATFYYSVTYTV